MNSVLRMHQSRHKTLSQGMLDLEAALLEHAGVSRWEAPWPLPL